jgi:hypothetical protein
MNRHTYRLYTLRVVLLGCAIAGAAQRASALPLTQTVNARNYNNTAPGATTDLGGAFLPSGTNEGDRADDDVYAGGSGLGRAVKY